MSTVRSLVVHRCIHATGELNEEVLTKERASPYEGKARCAEVHYTVYMPLVVKKIHAHFNLILEERL